MNADDRELLHASALELARRVADRTISSEELTRFFLARIARLDGELAAFVQVIERAALRDARRKDEALARHDVREPLPPFFGVPTAIKDLQFVRGAFTRLGSRAFRYLLSPVDDAVVARVRAGGFVLLGKLATSELGAMPVTEPDIHPPTRNPWSKEHTAGGSSGGSGAALAARLVPIAPGSDGAGSIRIPSAFCHLFGMKPSRGLVPNPYAKRVDALATCGPMGHSVDDVAALLEVMTGRSFLEPSRARPPRLRVRVVLDSPLVRATPEIAAQVRRVANVLEDLGHRIEEGAAPEVSLPEFLPLWQAAVARAPVLRMASLQPVTRWLAVAGKTLRLEDVARRHAELERRLAAWFGDVDLMLTPTVAIPPPRIGEHRGLPPEIAFERAARLGAFTALFNVTGQPAVNVPAAVGSDGLPIGVQLAAPRGGDGTLLAVARELEQAVPWAERSARGAP